MIVDTTTSNPPWDKSTLPRLYHYTSLATALKIIEGREIHLSSFVGLSDSAEGDALMQVALRYYADRGLNGVRPTPLHGLRHTWATLALQADVHPRVVQERLGHSNIATTLQTYSQVLPIMHDAAAATVAALFMPGYSM